MRRAWALAVAVSLVLAPTVGRAQNTVLNPQFRPEAERRNRRARAFYDQGRFEQALQLFQAAYDLYPEPRFLFNIGLAREKTFDYEGCATTFGRFVREATREPDDVRRQAAERLKLCHDRAEVPVRLTSAPSNAAIFIGEGANRVLRGRTPVELKLNPGTHVFTAEMPGFIATSQSVTVAPGERPQLDFVLEKLSTLRVEVDPAGAQVQIDDAPPEPAPAVREVQKGTHKVRVTKEGYEPVRRDVNVEGGREVSLVLSLRGLARPRQLAVRTDAPRALVRLDGLPVGFAPTTAPVRPGNHRVRVTAHGRVTYEGELTIPDDRDLLLKVRLEPRRSRANRVVFWSLLGTAAAAGVIGSVYGLAALDDESGFSTDPSVAASARGEHRAESADLWFAIGGVLGGGALAWHFLTIPGDSTSELESP